MTFGTSTGSGGFRFYDASHTVSYNYVYKVVGGPFQGPLQVDSGDVESGTALDAHWRIVGATVERNVLVGNPEGIRIGDNYTLAPTGCTIRDNVVAQSANGTAVTQVRAPVSTTLTNNAYSSTPAGAGLSQDSSAIWRKANYGPRLTYLSAAGVGIAGDLSDSDGTGVLVSGYTPPPGSDDMTTAAGRLNWGTPLTSSDEFDYDGTPDPTKWSVYNGVGHAGYGVRSPSRVTVTGGKMILTGLAGSANTAGLAHRFSQQYGRWEVRCRSYYTATPTATGLSGGYHPVIIVWPDSDLWPQDGEYDFLENGEPAEQAAGAFMHYPSLDGQNHQIDVPDYPVDCREFHNFAFEWTPNGVTGWVDGNLWFTYAGGAASDRKKIQDMPIAHLTVQLDADAASGMLGSTMEVDWVRIYQITPVGPPVGAQTVSPVGILSREVFGFPTVLGAEVTPPTGSVPTLLGSANCYLGSATLGYTSVITPPPGPAGSQTLSGAGNVFSAEAFGLPIVDVTDGPHTVNTVGIASVETFGRPTVAAGTPPTPAPGGVLVPALFAVGADDSTLTPLPNWSKISISPVRNAPGAVSIEYATDAAGFDTLHAGVSSTPLHVLEFRLWVGGNATGAVGGWLVQKSGDDLTPGNTWTFSGHFHEWLLKKAIVAPQEKSTANPNGELRFAGANPGLILGTLMDQAQARGALPLVTRDFSSTKDSNGLPWSYSISSFNLAPKTTIAQAADKLVELFMVEYEVTAARVFRAYNPGTHGSDKATGSHPLTFSQANDLAEHSRRESAEDAGNAVLAAGGEGFYDWSDSVTGLAELGWRAEVGYDVGQISSQAGVQAAADIQLEIARHGIAEYDGRIEFVLGAPLPLLDYGIGDWAYVVSGSTRTKQRIAQIGLTFQPGQGPQGTVALNDLITDRLTSLYRRLNALQTGDAVVGTSTPTPGGTGEDLNPPAAPTGLVVSSTIAYRMPGEGTVLALVSLGWAAVTTNAYPDETTAGKAAAASDIADRMRFGQTTAEDWTWVGMPTAVQIYGPPLHADWVSAGSPTPAVTWIAAYPQAHLGGGAITDDVDHYVVQYSYIGGAVVGSSSPPPDWVIPRNPDDPLGTGVEYTWLEPAESPTSGLTITFGDVTAEQAIGVRVAAVDRTGNQGPWSVVVGVVTAADDTPPPVPSTPIVSAWFETMDVTWDGKGSAGEDLRAAAPDMLGVEVHVSTGIAFVPDRPVGADGEVNYAASGTYQAMLYTAGTWNVTGLTVGVTYFARFVAVDNSGNASDPSATSAGVLPQQLVQIDIGPDAIGRAQIIDGEIVTAKIANLAVNDAKVSDLSVGKLTAGTMTANVVLGGRFTTPSSNNNHIEIDSAGLRLYQGNTVVGHWQVFDSSMLMTGQYQSAVVGPRFVSNPAGNNPDTIRFYPGIGTAYGEITGSTRDGLGAISVYSSTIRSDYARGEVTSWPNEATITWGNGDLGFVRSRIAAREVVSLIQSPVLDMNIRHQYPADQFGYRFSIFHSAVPGAVTVPGNDIAADSLMQFTFKNNAEPQILCSGRNSGLVFGASELFGTANNGSTCGFVGSYFNVVPSSRAEKKDIRDVDFDALDAARSAKPRKWRPSRGRLPADQVMVPGGYDRDGNPRPPTTLGAYTWDEPEERDHIGPMAQDLPAGVAVAVSDGRMGIDLASYAGMLHAALLQLDTRLAALEGEAMPTISEAQ